MENKKKEQLFKIGDKVRLISVPEWLLNGLPEECQVSIISCIWEIFNIENIEEDGYIWLGDKDFIEIWDDGVMHGRPTFCVTKDCIRKIF